MNRNPLTHLNFLYCAFSAVIVGTNEGELYLLVSNGEMAAKYIWPTKTRKRTRYFVSCERLKDLQYADEIESVAHRYGSQDNYPHICEELEIQKSVASVTIETNALRWALTFLPSEDKRIVRIDDKGLSIESVPLGGRAIHEAYMFVQSSSLRTTIEQMPQNEMAQVSILGCRNARAFAISLGSQAHYVRDYYTGLTTFIGEGKR